MYSCARPNLLFRKLYVKELVTPLRPVGLRLGRRVSRVVRARMPKTQESYSGGVYVITTHKSRYILALLFLCGLNEFDERASVFNEIIRRLVCKNILYPEEV